MIDSKYFFFKKLLSKNVCFITRLKQDFTFVVRGSFIVVVGNATFSEQTFGYVRPDLGHIFILGQISIPDC